MLTNKVNFQNVNYINFEKFKNSNISYPKLNTSLNKDVFNKVCAPKISFTGEIKPDYKDPDKFAEYLENKISKMLEDPTADEIKKMIKSVSDKSGVTEKKAAEIISRLTQFSNYSQMDMLGLELEKLGVYNEEDPFCNRENGFGINNVIRYIDYEKGQIPRLLSEKYGDTCNIKCFFPDFMALNYLKNNKYNEFDDFFENVKDGQTKIVIPDGWYARINGENVAHNLFGGPLSIEDAAVKIAKEVKKGKSLDEILNGEIIKRTKEVFGKDTKINLIKNPQARPSAKNISERLKSLYPNKEEIKTILDVLVLKGLNIFPEDLKSKEANMAREVLSKYFDNAIQCFSSESLTKILKKKYKEIEEFVLQQGKTTDDIVYVIPHSKKSFDLITYQYANINNINPNQIVTYNGWGNPKDFIKEGKVLVILDDVVGSGDSLMFQTFNYKNVKFHQKTMGEINTVFAPIFSTKTGKMNIEKTIKSINQPEKTDVLLPTVVSEDFVWSLTEKERCLLMKLIGNSGYSDDNCCVSVPYAIPDINSAASGVFLTKMLNSEYGNKVHYWSEYNEIIDKWLSESV